ncbi:MAG: M3 family oligoendopeptidase [Alphaproteobacteria bacterium]|nr:M3 family oligoendopeptidase [Alphaproteobacteria bacterium]
MPEWDLRDLYESPSDERFLSDMKRAGDDALAFSSRYEGKLRELAETAPSTLAYSVKEFEALNDSLGRLMVYADLLYESNTNKPECVKFRADVQEKVTTISSSLLFFSLELNGIDNSILDAAAQHEGLSYYKPWLDDLRKDRPYQLDAHLERLFHEKSVTSSVAWNRLFDETISSLRFDVGGETLSLEPVLNKLLSEEEEKRQAAAEALAETFNKNLPLFVCITNTLSKDKEISDKWRGFKDVASSRHLANRVEKPVIDALEQAVVEAYPRLSHRYYRLKAKWLGKDKLAHWDRNAPLPEQSLKVVSWAEARGIVLDAYHAFSPEMSEIASRFFERNWIDAPIRDGKSPGAFAHPAVPSVHPYVLVNYQGKLRDVMTLAHEIGHGVHQVLASSRGALMAPTSLTLAETASVFGEMLTFKSLLAKASDDKERRGLMVPKVEAMLNTVVRQIAFYRFERRVHISRADGELTAEKIAGIWNETQGESLGPFVTIDRSFETFWCGVPHFIHAPFYVYAYAFGDCLVNSLFAIYETGGEGFRDHYLDLLRAGGSKCYTELLEPFGLESSPDDPAFWTMGLSVIERMIDDLES